MGASGLVFGLFAFLLVRGFFNRSWWQILLSVVLFMAYGSILFGLIPSVAGYVSWQAHLGGAAGGVLAAVCCGHGARPAPANGPHKTLKRDAGRPQRGGRRRASGSAPPGELSVSPRTAWRTGSPP